MTAKSALTSGGRATLDVSPEVVADFCYRDFLLFIPSGVPSLRAVLSYYSATASVNQEGDVHINDTLQGFGKLFSSSVKFLVSSVAIHPWLLGTTVTARR